MKIFINAGHGGSDPGAVSNNMTKEKDITRTVAVFLAAMLIEKGYNIEFFQQEENVNEIVEAEKDSGSSLFISLHCNSATAASANGVEVLFYPSSGTGKSLAEIVSMKIADFMEIKNRGAKPRKDLRVLNGTKAPAILIELCFLSNAKEEQMLIKEPYSFATAITKGIEEWKK